MPTVSTVGDRPKVRTLLCQRLEVSRTQFKLVVVLVVGPASPWRRYCKGDGLRFRVKVLSDEEFLDALEVNSIALLKSQQTFQQSFYSSTIV